VGWTHDFEQVDESQVSPELFVTKSLPSLEISGFGKCVILSLQVPDNFTSRKGSKIPGLKRDSLVWDDWIFSLDK